MKQSTNLTSIEECLEDYPFARTLFPFDNAKIGQFLSPSNYFRLMFAKIGVFLTYINKLCAYTSTICLQNYRGNLYISIHSTRFKIESFARNLPLVFCSL